jgi:predicted transcriptional regulator
MLEKYLQDLGLNEKEAVVYLALLSVDNSSVLSLATKTAIKRPTVYIVLESLAKKGLVSETTVGKKTHYQAEPPERLETFVEQRKLILDEQAKRLKDVIPQIKSVQRESGERPIVKFFEGRQGIASANEEFFLEQKPGGVSYMVYPRDTLEAVFSETERGRYKKLRLDKHIRSKSIYTYSKGELPADQTGDRLRVDESRYPIKCDITIDGSCVRIAILGKHLSSIIIRSPDVAETLQSLINIIHDQKKRA